MRLGYFSGMGTQVQISGTLIAGPTEVSESTFPSGETSIPFVGTPNPRSYNVDTGKDVARVNSPSSFATLSGIGENATVPQANFLYLRCDVQVQVRVTQLVPSSTPTTATISVKGLLILEPPPGSEITLVEIQGSATVEYYACGVQ